MASIKEIRTRMKSVEQTLKITNAMYLISSAKLRKARMRLTAVTPYYQRLTETITEILRNSPDIHHLFFDQRAQKKERTVGFFILSGDKGLAGAYHHNLFRLAQEEMQSVASKKLFVVGNVGRSTMASKGYPLAENFLYTAQEPDMSRADDIAHELLEQFVNGEVDEIRVLYTHMVSATMVEPRSFQLLPLTVDAFPWLEEGKPKNPITYVPSPDAVLTNCVPGYVRGVLFSAMTEAFCSEQSARMNAMDASSKNAKEMLKSLSLSYNRARQAAITQEITEIVGGTQCGKDAI